MEKFNEKIYEDGITRLFGHHCLECVHLTFAQHEIKELAKYFYELGYYQVEKEIMAKSINAKCFGFQGAALFSFRLPADKYLVGSKVKVIVIEED